MSRLSFKTIDKHLSKYSNKLQDTVGLIPAEVDKVATLVEADVRFLEPEAKSQVINSSPVPIRDRIAELVAFQAWTNMAANVKGNPVITRAQVITQNYICFVYLPEACFRVLRRWSKPDSVTRRCCTFLTDNPVRAFRNAVAHSNWTYAEDFRSLVYWARQSEDPLGPLIEFQVTQSNLDFWQALSRGVAYAAYSTLISFGGK